MNITIAHGGTYPKLYGDRNIVDHRDSAVNNYRSHLRRASRHLSAQLTDQQEDQGWLESSNGPRRSVSSLLRDGQLH